MCDDVLAPLVFETVEGRAEELGGSATMLTEWGQCWPSYDHPEYQGWTNRSGHGDLLIHFSQKALSLNMPVRGNSTNLLKIV